MAESTVFGLAGDPALDIVRYAHRFMQYRERERERARELAQK